MKLLADESVEGSVVQALHDEGYDITYIATIAAGSKDDEVLKKAEDLGAILLTNDKDLVNLFFVWGRFTQVLS